MKKEYRTLIEAPLILENAKVKDGSLSFKLRAVSDNSMSQNGNFYDADFIDESIKRTNAFLEGGGLTTIYVTHAAAMGDFFSGTTKLPIGRTVGDWFREDTDMCANAIVVDTSEGQDVIKLLMADPPVMGHMSLRSYEYKMKRMRVYEEGEDEDDEDAGTEIRKGVWAVLHGIDFCDQPGIKGAGVTKIFESAPIMREITQEDAVDFEELTIEALRESRPDLLEAYLAGAVTSLVEDSQAKAARITELEAVEPEVVQDPETVAQNEALTTQVEALTGQVAALEEKVATRDKAATPVVQAIVERLEADPEADPKDVQREVIAQVLSEAGFDPGQTDSASTGDAPDVGDEHTDEAATMPDGFLHEAGQMLEHTAFLNRGVAEE